MAKFGDYVACHYRRICAFTIFVVKYRYTQERKDMIPKDIKGNKKLELTYTIIPCILLLILAVPTVKVTLDQSPSTEAAKEDGVHINVNARQFEWKFEHENGKEAKDELILPENEPIIFHLKSEDVIHSFLDTRACWEGGCFPNKELTYIIRDMKKGTYDGKCAEFCGIQHANMRFTVKVVSEDEYKDYLEKETKDE